MKQKNLIQQVYQACIRHDTQALKNLQQEEFQKIFQRRKKHKDFDAKWTVVRL